MFSDAQAIARRIAAAASARIGEPLWLRDYPAPVDGEIGRVVLGVARDGLHRTIGVISDLGAIVTATIEHERRLRGHQLGDEAAVVEAIAVATREPLGLLDAGYAVFDMLQQCLAVAGSAWRLSTWGEWGDTSGVSVELYGTHAWGDLISIRGTTDAVRIAIPASVMEAPDREHLVSEPPALVAALPMIVDEVRAAIDARATARTRPDGIADFGHRLLAALRVRGTLAIRDQFPRAWPTATIDAAFVSLAETAAGVTVTVDSTFGPYRAFADAELVAIAAEVRAATKRLRPGKLVAGRSYVTIAPVRALASGTRLLFVAVDHVPREGFAIYRFTSAGSGDTHLELCEDSDADAELLARIHTWLARTD
jgi:hypothetical protein